MDDVELVERAKAGQPAAFAQLVQKYQDRVFNTCWRICGHHEDARDVTQEAFIKAYQNLHAFRQESAFYTGAISGAGARGLMQIMPATARRVARQIKVRYSRKKLLSDPEYNLRLGRAYLADLTEKYDGSYILALAAYNAGPARTNRWMKTFGDPRTPGVDPVDWIESIPFNETRNYVQRILESLVVYRKTLGVPDSDPVIVGGTRFRSLAENAQPD